MTQEGSHCSSVLAQSLRSLSVTFVLFYFTWFLEAWFLVIALTVLDCPVDQTGLKVRGLPASAGLGLKA